MTLANPFERLSGSVPPQPSSRTVGVKLSPTPSVRSGGLNRTCKSASEPRQAAREGKLGVLGTESCGVHYAGTGPAPCRCAANEDRNDSNAGFCTERNGFNCGVVTAGRYLEGECPGAWDLNQERAGGINSAPSRIGFAESYPRVRERGSLNVQYATVHDTRRISVALLGDDRGAWLERRTLHGAACRSRDNDEAGGSGSDRAAIYYRKLHIAGWMLPEIPPRSAAAHDTKCRRTGDVRQHGDRLPHTGADSSNVPLGRRELWYRRLRSADAP